ncbi:MAG: ribonuclease HII [Deltaproteobacteria bacterium]
MLYFEKKFKKSGYSLIIGVDEVGRGSLAGPVVAAAVMLKNTSFRSRIDDSKRLTAGQREEAFPEIVGKSVFGIGIVDEKIVDRLNIAVATQIAMEQAICELIDKLGELRDQKIRVLIDGNVKPDITHPFTNIIKGDSRSKSIACASILAKVIRDRIMSIYHNAYPQYGFARHKGYGTRLHKYAIRKFGLCAIHRTTFCDA